MKYGWEWKYLNQTFFGVSLAGIRTSIIWRELSLCFDVAQGLPHCQKAKIICLTHGHLDHASGLPYVLSMMAMHGKTPQVFMPESLIKPMREIMRLWQSIDEFDYPLNFEAAPLDKLVEINSRFSFTAIKSDHRIPSCGYAVFENRKKLKQEYRSVEKNELIALKNQGIEIETTSSIPFMVFSGDTRSEFLENETVKNCKVLFIECTYLDSKKPISNAREWGHTHADEIIEKLPSLKCEKIVIKHVSSRYNIKEIEQTFRSRLSPEEFARIVIFQGR